jgi:sugar lactone lactonase YvrE
MNGTQFLVAGLLVGALSGCSAATGSNLGGASFPLARATVRNPAASGNYVKTIAGKTGICNWQDGIGKNAFFCGPDGVAFDSANRTIYVTDASNDVIRSVTTSGKVGTIAGTPHVSGFANGKGGKGLFSTMHDIVYDPDDGNLYVTDAGNCAIRRVTTTGVVTTIAGKPGPCGDVDGQGAAAQFSNGISGIAYDSKDRNLYVVDSDNCNIRRVSTKGTVKWFAGGGGPGTTGACGFGDGTASTAGFNLSIGIAYDSKNGNFYLGDSGNCAIRQITATGNVTTIAGPGCGANDGQGSAAQLGLPDGNLAYVASKNLLYLADFGNCAIRQITTAGAVTTIAGKYTSCSIARDGPGSAALFIAPEGIAGSVTSLYVGDEANLYHSGELIRTVSI